MRKVHPAAAIFGGLWLILCVAPSWAQRPLTNDVSDTMANTGGGTGALTNIKTGTANTAYGNLALQSNTTGIGNTAIGFDALGSTNGNENTAVGDAALTFSNTGNANTAVGSGALEINPTGSNNTAVGANSLQNNTGDDNTAVGESALVSNAGGSNTAVGFSALGKNTTGNGNTVIGENALADNTTGSNNIAIGLDAGAKLTSGSDNIYLGADSLASESKTMRLGHGQTHTFVAGIAGRPLIGSQVVVTTAGQLGILASSARFKRDIENIGDRSRGLVQLRPVTFRYKGDPQRARQYGLIAEEVAKVYPELVARGTDGVVVSVQYHELIPMLLNELQRQEREFHELKTQNAALTARLARLEEAVPHLASLDIR